MSEQKNATMLSIRIREKRNHCGISQQGLADLLGVTKSTVGGWESEGKVPDIQRWPSLMEFLGIRSDEMLCLALDGNIPDPNSYEEICKKIQNPWESVPMWAKDLAGRIMSHGRQDGTPYYCWAEMVVSMVLMVNAEDTPQEKLYVAKVLDALLNLSETCRLAGNLGFSSGLLRVDEGKSYTSVAKIWQNLQPADQQAALTYAIRAVEPIAQWEKENCEECRLWLQEQEKKCKEQIEDSYF